jgi:hypothetical protein
MSLNDGRGTSSRAVTPDAARDLSSEQRKIDYQKIFEGAPALFLLLGADESFPILDASDEYLRATYTERDKIVGRSLFEVFPGGSQDQRRPCDRPGLLHR